MNEEYHHIARQAAALDDPRLCRDSGGVTDAQDEAPARIRVARDADGFWTCREAVSGSPEYVRSDLARPSQAWDERVTRLVKEYRPTMDAEVLHSWAQDVVAALAAMDTPKGGGE